MSHPDPPGTPTGPWAPRIHPGFHFGRAWKGTEIEDGCPCRKAPCGLVDESDQDCPQHHATKTMRQIHRADRCPDLPPCPQCGGTDKCTGDQRWEHMRDYRCSEATILRKYGNGPSVMWRGGRVEVTQ